MLLAPKIQNDGSYFILLTSRVLIAFFINFIYFDAHILKVQVKSKLRKLFVYVILETLTFGEIVKETGINEFLTETLIYL